MSAKRGRVNDIRQQRCIQKFGKISKSQSAPIANNYRKRKLEQDEIPPFSHSVSVEAPSTPCKKARVQIDVRETPTRGACAQLQCFNLASPPTKRTSSEPKQLETPPSSQGEVVASKLPDELKELSDLHSCFLTALSLHYAHNGRTTQVDLRNLYPTIAKSWGKRRVDLDTIRRLLAVQQTHGYRERKRPQNELILIDCGDNKTCIELAEVVSQSSRRRPVDEETLNRHFSESLLQLWERFKKENPTSCSVATFIESLPLHPIKSGASPNKSTTRRSKGQIRLDDLKASAIKTKERALGATEANAPPPSKENPKIKDPFARSADLKSRIFAKQLQQASLPTPLTPEQVARRSALHRTVEAARVLESLSVAAQRHRNDDAEDTWAQTTKHVSFAMPALVQNLQMSLRNPISGDEAGRCVRIIGELVPEWVSVREVGKLVGVTIRGAGIERVALAARVEVALKKM